MDELRSEPAPRKGKVPAPLRAVAYAFAYGDIPAAQALLRETRAVAPATRAALLAACDWRAGRWAEGARALRFAYEAGEESPWVAEALAQAWTLVGLRERAPALPPRLPREGYERLPMLPASRLGEAARAALKAALLEAPQAPERRSDETPAPPPGGAGVAPRSAPPPPHGALRGARTIKWGPSELPPWCVESAQRAFQWAKLEEHPPWLEGDQRKSTLIEGLTRPSWVVEGALEPEEMQRLRPYERTRMSSHEQGRGRLSSELTREAARLPPLGITAPPSIALRLPAPVLSRPGQGARSVQGEFLFALTAEGLILCSLLEGSKPWKLKREAVLRWSLKENELSFLLFDQRGISFDLSAMRASPELTERLRGLLRAGLPAEQEE